MLTLFVTSNLTDSVTTINVQNEIFRIDAKSSFTAVVLAWFVKQCLQNHSMIAAMAVVRRISSVLPLTDQSTLNFIIILSSLISQILDHEQEVCSTTGKSHAVIPAFTFYRDRTGDEEEKQGKRGNNTSYCLTKSVSGCSFAPQL